MCWGREYKIYISVTSVFQCKICLYVYEESKLYNIVAIIVRCVDRRVIEFILYCKISINALYVYDYLILYTIKCIVNSFNWNKRQKNFSTVFSKWPLKFKQYVELLGLFGFVIEHEQTYCYSAIHRKNSVYPYTFLSVLVCTSSGK